MVGYLAIESEVSDLYERDEPQIVGVRDYGSRQSDIQLFLAECVRGGYPAAFERGVAEIVARFRQLFVGARGQMMHQESCDHQGYEEGSDQKESAARRDCAGSFTSERCCVRVHHRQNLAGLGHIMCKPEIRREPER